MGAVETENFVFFSEVGQEAGAMGPGMFTRVEVAGRAGLLTGCRLRVTKEMEAAQTLELWNSPPRL